MQYKPVTAVWEVTMGCNMRCGHCGSSCEEALAGELTTQEALLLADQIVDIGLKWITLSGGEPLTRADLPLIIERISNGGVYPNIITNGWLLTPEMVRKLKASGVATVAISVDGDREVHDKIRMKGSYDRIIEAFKNLRDEDAHIAAITTVSNENIHLLPQIREMLISNGVKIWQVQIGMPMGNFKEHPDWVIRPEQMTEIIDFCYETSMEGKIMLAPADCIGYYGEKELKIRQNFSKSNADVGWNGCSAGVNSFGILHNGDILGCTSIRDKDYIEGNVKEQTLREIWENPDNFAWRRKMTKNDLAGDCVTCVYASRCLGGCPNTRLTMNGDVYSENCYCSYNLALKTIKRNLEGVDDVGRLVYTARHNLEAKSFQAASLLAQRALILEPENKEALDMQGFAEFMCGNYEKCEEINKKALKIDPDNAYAAKGLGLALHKLGNSNKGLEYLEQAAKMTNYEDDDIMHDLNYVKQEMAAG